MSLTESKTYSIGIIAAISFDNPDWFTERLAPHLEQISAVHTNGANALVTEFCRQNGVCYSVWPINGGRTAPWSNSRIIENSDKVYILATAESKNSKQAQQECVKKKVSFELIEFEPAGHWKEKIGKVAEIVAACPKEEQNETLKAIGRVL